MKGHRFSQLHPLWKTSAFCDLLPLAAAWLAHLSTIAHRIPCTVLVFADQKIDASHLRQPETFSKGMK
jgi:hypothetical protein